MIERKKGVVRIAGLVLFAVSLLLHLSFQARRSLGVRDLKAPVLGRTATSILLLWEDDLLDDSKVEDYYRYFIYLNEKLIDSSTRRTYIIDGLNPSSEYKVTIKSKMPDGSLVAVSLTVITKKRGAISNVRKFGANGNGTSDDTRSIQSAVMNCERFGTVLIPPGTYLLSHLELKSEITIELQKGARLVFMGYESKNDIPVKSGTLKGVTGEFEFSNFSLISAIDVHDVTITGEGIIDGNGDMWWPHTSNTRRPMLLEFISCTDIYVQQVTMQDPPYYNNHLLYVDNAIYAGVRFLKVSTDHGTNGDGLDPEGARNVLVVGCVFGNQDDSISIKGHGDCRISTDITVRDCLFDGNAAPGSAPLGFALGSGCKVRRVVVENCIFHNAASLANIKTNRNRPFTFAEEIVIRNIRYFNTFHIDRMWNRAPISIDQFYYAEENEDPAIAEPLKPQTPFFRNIHFENISIENPVGMGIFLCGLPELPLREITFDEVKIVSLVGIIAQNVDSLDMSGIRLLPAGRKINPSK